MKGIYVASVVAYDEKGALNAEAQQALYDRNLQEGANGFFIGGSSGECFLLSPEERVKSFEVASTYLNQAELFAHVGALSTDEAIYYAKKAKALGYKNIAATPPFYFGYSQAAIAQYYKDISEAIHMPVLFYNIPSNTNKELILTDPATREVLKSGAISGVKHTNFDINQMERIRNINPKLQMFGGLEQNMVAFMALGCDAFIGSTFNFMLPHYKKIYELTEAKQTEEALKLQVKANNIMECIWNIGLFPAIKYIVGKQGIHVGSVRKPFLPLTDKEKEIIDQVLEENLFQE